MALLSQTSSKNDETLKQEITELHQLVAVLPQTRHSTNEVDAVEIIDIESRTVQKTDPPCWQAIQRQLKVLKSQVLNPESHLKATKATLAEIAKHYLEDSVVSKALITCIDTLSTEAELEE